MGRRRPGRRRPGRRPEGRRNLKPLTGQQSPGSDAPLVVVFVPGTGRSWVRSPVRAPTGSNNNISHIDVSLCLPHSLKTSQHNLE